MSWDYTDTDLVDIARVDPNECPLGEEGEWLYIIENAALEARLRGRCVLHARLRRLFARMRKIARLRGYYAEGDADGGRWHGSPGCVPSTSKGPRTRRWYDRTNI